MTPIEIIALVFAIAVLSKLLIIFFSPGSWMNIAEKFLKSSMLATVVYLVLAVIIGNYIFVSFSIIDVAAITTFVALLMGIAFLPYSKEMLNLAKTMLKKNHHITKNWLSMIIWALLAIWVLYTLFA